MDDGPAVPDDVLGELRDVCLGLPEAYEEPAWVGTRWRIRTKTFAHVLVVADGRPAAYARAVGDPGPLTVLTFRTPIPDRAPFRDGHPFFVPVWFDDIVGVLLDDDTDWDEVADLLTESYCALAPKKLARLVARPPA